MPGSHGRMCTRLAPWCQAATERMLKGGHTYWGIELSSLIPEDSRKGVFGSGRKGAKSYKVLETVASCSHASCAIKLTESRTLLFSLLPKVGVVATQRPDAWCQDLEN